MKRLIPFCLMAAAPLLAQEPSAPSGKLAAALQPFVDDGTMAGAVMLVGDRRGIVDLETVGYADLAARKPMTADAEFWIASMSKAMTAAALMIATDDGKLSPDDPVEKYLPEFHGIPVVAKDDPTHTPRPADHPILIREILSHTSGMPFRSGAAQGSLDSRPLAEATALEAKGPLFAQPGTVYAYSNAGINTAGRIVEVVEGMPFEEFLRERLFDPLGMRDTTFWPTPEQEARLAKTYKGPSGALEETGLGQLSLPLGDRTKRFPIPAGGLFSTASDVAAFCRMLLNNGVADDGARLLSPEAVRRMTTKETPSAVAVSYGFGLDVHDDSFSHGGAYHTYMKVDRKQGLVLVFLVQKADGWTKERDPQAAFLQAAYALTGGPGTPDVNAATEGQAPR